VKCGENRKTCPLCGSKDRHTSLPGPDGREFFLCRLCRLVFTDKKYFLSREKERERYLQHNNSSDSPGYIEFLNRAVNPSIRFLGKRIAGLDYGCGPEPVLSQILKSRGFESEWYDPIFYPELDLDKRYGFIFSTETFEHFFSPAAELDRLRTLLSPGGILTVMTKLRKSPERFREWHYARDPSHVAFYSRDTLEFISERWDIKIVYCDNESVCIFRKPGQFFIEQQ